MTIGWYWYRYTGTEYDPASSGDWVVLYVNEFNSAEVADLSFNVDQLKGEWRGPINPPPD